MSSSAVAPTSVTNPGSGVSGAGLSSRTGSWSGSSGSIRTGAGGVSTAERIAYTALPSGATTTSE